MNDKTVVQIKTLDKNQDEI